ncbi:MAG: VWA domain-containing protein [Chloroflexota bacterium]|nr:VWA domain-containing protein [Chloroflexota bacterium]
MPDDIILNPRLNIATVPTSPTSSEPRLLYLLVDISPGENVQPLEAPVNIALVLDVSESMRLPVLSQAQFRELQKMGHVNKTVSDGVDVWTFSHIPEAIRRQAPSNLDAVQSSIADAARHFEARDTVSLVGFADRAEVLLRGLPGSDTQRLLEAVAQLGGISLGDETDIAAGLEAGIEEVARSHTRGAISRVLVLTDGFTKEPEHVARLAAQARQSGIAVSTLGIGTEFNEKLLLDMADASLGNAYFARTPQEIAPAFASELAMVQAVSLRDVQVEVRLSTGVEVRRAYRVRPAIAPIRLGTGKRVAGLPLGDLDPKNPHAILLELIVPPHPGGTFRVAHIEASHSDATGIRVSNVGNDIVVSYVAGGKLMQPDPAVMNIVERVTAFVLQTRALDDMAAGNPAAATQKLRAAATRLLTVGESDLARTVQLEAEQIESSGQASQSGTKEIRYATRKLST